MSKHLDHWVELILPKDAAKEIIRALLDLAPDVHDVRTQGNGDSVLVPPDLADAYHASVAPKPKPRTRAKKAEEDS